MLDESDVPLDIRAEYRALYVLSAGRRAVPGLSVPGRNNETQAGRRAYNIVWYRPTDRGTRWSISAPTRPAGATAPRSLRR